MLSPCKKSYDKPRQHIKQHRHHFANKVPYRQRYKLIAKELMLLNFGSEEDSRESLGLQGDQISQP